MVSGVVSKFNDFFKYKNMMNIKNVVFDIGNVMVRWSPQEIIRLTFSERVDINDTAQKIFQSESWFDLNKGLLTENETKNRLRSQFELTEQVVDTLFYYVKQTQIPLYGSMDLLVRVKAAGYGVYALTDNVIDIVEFLQQTYDFWPLFDGAVVSAEVGLLKPQPEIYQRLLLDNQLIAEETIFLDDMPHNVKGAQAVGMHAFQFEDAWQAERMLKERFGVSV